MLEQENADFLAYCPNYVFQLTITCGFAVLRLMQSPAADYLDAVASKKLFNSAIVAIRKIGVSNNDFPGRLAEVLVQLKARGSGQKIDWGNLHLNVRSRMSMSVMFDSLWEWRKGFEPETGKSRTSMQK
jgi:transcriptional regulatory protein LEU3